MNKNCVMSATYSVELRSRNLLLVIVFLVLQASSFGQFGVEEIGRYIPSIPNPAYDLSVVDLFSNKSVAKEIGLSDKAIKELNALKEEAGGSLSSPMVAFDGTPSDEEAALIVTSMRALVVKNKKRINEILEPSQIGRLRQIVYQLEIARVGLEEALTDGYFGKAIGITDAQKPALMIYAQLIDKTASEELMKILSVAMEELTANLTAEQRSDIERVLGRGFVFLNVQSGRV